MTGLVGLLAMGAALASPARAASTTSTPSRDVSPEVHRDVSAPLRMLKGASAGTARSYPAKPIRTRSEGSPTVVAGATVGAAAPVAAAPTALMNFDGVGQGFVGPAGAFAVASAPPDTIGAVGPNHYVQTVNASMAVFNKNGTVLFGPVLLKTLWAGFGGGCEANNDGDPAVQYDPMADRWFISQFSVSTQPFLQCVAISQTPDPTGAYYRYSFSYSGFNDYPKFGVWPDGYYATFNMFNAAGTAFQGAKVCAYDRVSMLQGLAATQQCFDTSTAFGGLLPADLDGSRLPPVGAPEQVLGLGATTSTLASWKFHVDWATPANSTFTGPTALTVATYQEACGTSGTCVPQLGTTQQLDSLSDRLMNRLAYRNFADGHQSLVASHSVTAGSSVGERWYELRLDGANDPSVFQQGTYAPDATYRWMGSIAQDQSGNMALGYSASSSAINPQIRYTGRLAGDAAGQMTQGETTLIAGAGSQTTTLSRWGDYSQMDIDPVDDCTFWYTNEYLTSNGTFNWRTRIGSFKLPGCGVIAANDFSISAAPAAVSVVAGSSGTSTISTALVSGTAESVSLSTSGVPAGASASLSPSSVAAGASSTLTLSSGTAAPGTYTITVTGSAASATHATTVSFTITASTPPDFTLALSPTNVSVAAGSSAPVNVSTTAVNASTQTVSLSATGLPAGVTASFSPTSVVAGGSATLTLSAAASASASTSTITVTGTAGTTSHAATASLAVTTTGPTTTVLTTGVPVSAISGATSSQQFFRIDVPAGQDSLIVTIRGGTGDADLYVRRGSLPTTSAYDCRPYVSGNNETCTFNAPAAGSWYLMLRGYTAFTGVTLTATYATTTALANGVPVTGLSGALGSQTFFKLDVPAGRTAVTFTISGGSGDADLYIRFGSKPTVLAFSCRPFLTGNNETCTFNAPAAGAWYVMVRGFAAYSGLAVKGTYV